MTQRTLADIKDDLQSTLEYMKILELADDHLVMSVLDEVDGLVKAIEAMAAYLRGETSRRELLKSVESLELNME